MTYREYEAMLFTRFEPLSRDRWDDSVFATRQHILDERLRNVDLSLEADEILTESLERRA